MNAQSASRLFLPRPPERLEERIETANATMRTESEVAPWKTVEWHEANDAKGKIKAKGPMPKVLKLLPLLKPAYAAYPGIAKEHGLL